MGIAIVFIYVSIFMYANNFCNLNCVRMYFIYIYLLLLLQYIITVYNFYTYTHTVCTYGLAVCINKICIL